MLKNRYMVVGTGPTTPADVVSADRDVRHPLPAEHAPVLELGQMLGSRTTQTLSFHQPPWPGPLGPDRMWLWMRRGITPTPSPPNDGSKSKKLGWLGHVRVDVLSGHWAKTFAPSAGLKTLLEPVTPPVKPGTVKQGIPKIPQRGCRNPGTMTSNVLLAVSGTGSLVASAPTAHGLLVEVVGGPEELQK